MKDPGFFQSPHIALIINCVVFFLGACVGSFLNVVIYRLPRGLSVNSPKRSFCPSCEKPIPWFRNIPLISWVLLRGKCAECHAKISVRYWIVELLTAFLFLAIWASFTPIICLPLWIWLALAIAISFIDAEHYIVPLPLAWVAAVMGFLAVLSQLHFDFYIEETLAKSALYSIIGAAVGYGLIRAVIELGKIAFGKWTRNFAEPVNWQLIEPENDTDELKFVIGEEIASWSELFYRKTDQIILKNATLSIDKNPPVSGTVYIKSNKIFFGDQSFDIESLKSASGTTSSAEIPREAMGLGDAHVMLMIGALCGWQGVCFSLISGSVIGVVFGILARLGFGHRLPFGPCLLAGAAIWLFFGSEIWNWYFSLISPVFFEDLTC